MKLGWVVFFEAALINVLFTAVIMARVRGDLTGTPFIGALVGVLVFSAAMFYIAKSLDRMLSSDSKKEAKSAN